MMQNIRSKTITPRDIDNIGLYANHEIIIVVIPTTKEIIIKTIPVKKEKIREIAGINANKIVIGETIAFKQPKINIIPRSLNPQHIKVLTNSCFSIISSGETIPYSKKAIFE